MADTIQLDRCKASFIRDDLVLDDEVIVTVDQVIAYLQQHKEQA